MRCLQCQHENASDAKFCNQCATSLIATAFDPSSVQSMHQEVDSVSRLYVVLPFVISLLRVEHRVTYRTLKDAFRLDDILLAEIRKELRLRRLAIDEEDEVLVWVEERTPRGQAGEVDPRPQHTAPTLPISPVSPVSQPHVVATDVQTDGPTASPEDLSTASLRDEPAIIPAPTSSTSDAERRQLTVMFCDLVGSTDLSGKLDPEDLREVVRAYQETAAEVIQRYEGHIAQYLGDGLLIYFGFPVAHEDDAQRSIYTGLGISEAMADLNTRLKTEYGVELAVRIGIHTGPVVVGEMGGGGRHENLALGETPNIAARLEGLAQANTAVISPVTAQLVQRVFVLEELGLHDLKGVSEPMMLYSVIGPRDSEHDDHDGMLSGGFDALVGRDEEIGLLLRRWDQSKEGQGQVVLISGEAGLGKSSLVEGLRAHVRQEGFTRIAFRCSPYTENSALHPVIEHVQQVLGWQREDSDKTRLAKLEQSLGGYQFPSEESVPLLASLLSLSLPEDRYPPLTLSPQQQRQHLNDTLVAWMLEEAERQPILAAWEDLHWADPSTLELLGLLVDQTPTVPMMNVLAFRSVFTPPWPSGFHFTPIMLNRLERLHIETLVSRLAGGKGLPQEVVHHVVSKTDGVPLYVEELTKMLLESELIEEEAEQYVLRGSLSEATIPATLQDSLMARLDRLPTVKEVAQLGAVLGREFAYEMLQGLSSVEEAVLQAGLSQLVDTELLYQRGRLPRAKYIFRHALIRDAAYESLLRRTRQQVHERVAQLLEARFSEVVETQPELVAYHYTEAGLADQAIPYWQRAGQRALQGSAPVEAIAHLTQGLAVLTALPETPARLQQELGLQVTLGPALMAAKGHGVPDMERAYARARELCQQIGDTVQLFPVLRGLMMYYQAQGQLQTAYQLGEELLRLAQSQPEPASLMLAHFQLGMVLFFRGEPAASHPHHSQAIAVYDPQAHQALALRYGIDIGMVSRGYLALVLWQLGYLDQALQSSQEARMLAQQVSHPFSRSLVLIWSAVLHQFRREAPASQEQAAAAMTLAKEQVFRQWLAFSTTLHGWARAMQGQIEAGLAEIRQGFEVVVEDAADKLLHAYFLGLMAEICGADGHPEKGLSLLDEALAVIDDTEVCFYEAELSRLKGVLLLRLASSDASQAEACFQKALSVARRQQAKSWELRAATSLARLWQSQGKYQDAYDLLAPVYNWFTEGFDTADLIEAKHLLDELSAETQPSTA